MLRRKMSQVVLRGPRETMQPATSHAWQSHARKWDGCDGTAVAVLAVIPFSG
jgi:hypothetical protein